MIKGPLDLRADLQVDVFRIGVGIQGLHRLVKATPVIHQGPDLVHGQDGPDPDIVKAVRQRDMYADGTAGIVFQKPDRLPYQPLCGHRTGWPGKAPPDRMA